MRFTRDFVERVVELNNLVDYVSEVTQLKPARGGYMGRCPFPSHPEKTPSFSVSESKQVYHCFGCKRSGDLIQFLRDYYGLSYPEAIEKLADRAGVPLPVSADSREQNDDERRQNLRRDLIRANQVAQEFFQKNFAEDPHGLVHQYVEKRQISPETAAQFGLGYAPASFDGLAQHLRKRGISWEIGERAGLLRSRSSGGQGYFDFFRDRLMFPIRKTSGEIIAFGGRILQSGEPKYLNSPETEVFSKSKALYGLDQTARFIRSQDQAILVEGYMDLISLFQNGFETAVAPLGTAFTADHASQLSRMTKNIFVLFDGDSAGQGAAERSLPLLLRAGARPRGVFLPQGMDPDEYLRSPNSSGAKGLREALRSAPDLFNLVLHRWTISFRGSSSEKVAQVDRWAPLFEMISDPRLKELYLEDLASRLHMTSSQIRRMWNSAGGKNTENSSAFSSTGPAPRQFSATTKSGSGIHLREKSSEDLRSEQNRGQVFSVKGASKAERLLLSLVLRDRAHLEYVLQQGILEVGLQGDIRQIFQWLHESSRQEPSRFDRLSSLLISQIDDPNVIFEASEKLGLGRMASPGTERETEERTEVERTNETEESKELEAGLLRECVRKVQSDALKFQIERLQQDLKLNPTREGMEKLIQLQKDRLNESGTR